jgi:hypothetical protein
MLNKQRKNSLGNPLSKRYAQPISKNRARSRIQQSYDVGHSHHNRSISKDRDEYELNSKDSKMIGVVNLPTLNRRQQRRIFLNKG